MIAHIVLPVSKYLDAKAFYTKVLLPIGYGPRMEHGKSCGFMESNHTSFWICKQDTENIRPIHVAFEAQSKEEVDEFYRIALEHGAKDNGKPGYRHEYWPGYYAAFFIDPDGHNIEAVWYDYSKENIDT